MAKKPMAAAQQQISDSVRQVIVSLEASDSSISSLAKSFTTYSRPDRVEELGALKVFTIPQDEEAATRSFQRLQNEIKALTGFDWNEGVLRIPDSNAEEHWMITDYHPGGTLNDNLTVFKGNALLALSALRPIVAALARLHSNGTVHRDIKPHNIFLNSACLNRPFLRNREFYFD